MLKVLYAGLATGLASLVIALAPFAPDSATAHQRDQHPWVLENIPWPNPFLPNEKEVLNMFGMPAPFPCTMPGTSICREIIPPLDPVISFLIKRSSKKRSRFRPADPL